MECEPPMLSSLRVALVHDWLTGMRGGEKVLEVFCELFPQAPIHTLLHVPGSVTRSIESHPIVTSPLQRIPGIGQRYRSFLPAMPWIMDRMRIAPVDLVLSTSHCVAKGARAPAGAVHASYVLSPMRYLYDRYDDYFAPGRAGIATRLGMRLVRGPLRRWDCRTVGRADVMASISRFVRDRIRDVYKRETQVIHPPVDVDRFARVRSTPGDYYLMVSALVPYKNVDVAIEAFRGLGRRLLIAGSGPMEARLRRGLPRNVELLGWVDDRELPSLVAGCRAFLFPNVEDFGIAPVEAMAAGRPVLALGEGGALDTVVPADPPNAGGEASAPTGLFFQGRNGRLSAALADAVRRFEAMEDRFDSDRIRGWARRFDREHFKAHIRDWLAEALRLRTVGKAA